MHSKCDNIETMINGKADEVIEKLLKSLFNRYQTGFETSIRENDIIFDYCYLLYYKCHKISFK